VTFSIVARDPQTGTLGIAVSTALPCVGVGCPYVTTGVGAIASQSWTNPRLGVDGLKLLELGLSPEVAITTLLNEDEGAAKRQVGAVDAWGRVFAYSGTECTGWFGHRTSAQGGQAAARPGGSASGGGHQYSVQGNMLVGGETIDAMAAAFERTEGMLPARLMAAMEAGQAAGGDKRGRVSAAIIVRPPTSALWEGIDIRVDEHPDPVAELRRIFDIVQEQARETRAELERLREAGGR
jgi:uncharacterized Ntn-hydrolase superfamily protein